MGRILVIDDELSVRESIREMLAEQGHEVSSAPDARQAMAMVSQSPPDLIICDVQLPDQNGLELFRLIKEGYPRLPVIIMTGYGTTEIAIEATKLGAFDYQLKPFDPSQMLRTVERALESVRLMRRGVAIDPAALTDLADALVGQSPPMQEVYKAIGRVAATEASVLIRGETGTGKELVARALYQHSLRRDRPLLVVNCVAIPETLLESELFGYERGAFTGAVARRIGKFEQAHAGTLFLDEIGDVPLVTQAKLLRVLQDHEFSRLGGNETIRVDTRVITATNRDLERAIVENRFREDLYHRLNVVTISLPPLRERGADICRLAYHFLRCQAAELKLQEPPLGEDALDELTRYPWPGNVRELRHAIQRALIFTQGYPIRRADIRRALEKPAETSADRGANASDGNGAAWRTGRAAGGDLSRGIESIEGIHVGMTLAEVEKVLLARTLEAVGGNKKEAARILGISRRAVYDKLRRYDPG